MSVRLASLTWRMGLSPSSYQLCDFRLIGIIQDKSDHEIDLILDDFAVINSDLLLFNPRAAHVAERLGRAVDAALNGVLKTFS